ncbi:TIGR00730 family Rossman fold protein [Chryseobacterium sp. T16E-39]|uniref:LOG family protein n=1 Tax=Chryseobacterium sp. T16E-39 TaxID=2015076 RepID=UPI0015609212|nr:TIGR00730 family Rossman fold protein [Chryseobacterium sp. T16E-39]
MKRLTVFCGSSFGAEPIYEDQAYALGKKLVEEKIGLVYGGAISGLMGVVANGVMENGGEAIGVLPHFLKGKEIAHQNLTDLILVETMHERKTKMNELSDGVIALPGGYGTLEELFEMMTWAQLGLHQKPIAVLNVNGFYDDLLKMTQTMVDKGFLKEANQKMLIVDDNIDVLLAKMKNYEAPKVDKWISKDKV